MLRLYNTLLLPIRVVVRIRAAWAARLGGSAAREWGERTARLLPEIAPGGLWIHGASVGEARLTGLLVDALRARRPGIPIAASAYTRTGRAQLPGAPRVDAAFFVPLDLAGYPDRVLDAARPAALTLVETELWPNLLSSVAGRHIPTVLVNARLSPERMPRYRRLRRLYRPLLAGLFRVGAQTAADGERWLEMGVRPEALVVTGNIKYDLPAPDVTAQELRSRFAIAPDRTVLVAGSTGEGEDGPVLDAFLRVRQDHPRSFLILAPRHPERCDDVARQAADRGVRLHRLSHGQDGRAGSADGLLVDAVGQLAKLYAAASVAFVGGSLVPIGGHNVLEPAALGVPVLFGPHIHHVEDPARSLLSAGGAEVVRDSSELAAAWSRLLGNQGARRSMARHAAGVIEASRGALDRSVDLVLAALGAGAASRPA